MEQPGACARLFQSHMVFLFYLNSMYIIPHSELTVPSARKMHTFCASSNFLSTWDNLLSRYPAGLTILDRMELAREPTSFSRFSAFFMA
jgi:hypothetical protein